MAYHIEGTDIVIDGWENGMAASPYAGFAELSYGSILNTQGEFAVQFPLAASTLSGGTVASPSQIAAEIDAGNGGTVSKYWMIDTSRQVWTSNTVGNVVTWTKRATVGASTVANPGIVVWKGYGLVFLGNKVFWATIADPTNWTDWSAISSTSNGYGALAISASDDAVYFCSGPGVGSVLLNAGATFDPSNAATYTFNNAALAIPTNDLATCLAENQAALLVGSALNRVYNWDRIDTTFSNIIYLAERFVYRMVTTNTNTYVFVGHPVIPSGRGNIYVTNGSQADVWQKMPDSFINTVNGDGTDQEPYWVFGDAMYHRNQIVFGAVAFSNINAGTVVAGTGGVWAVDVEAAPSQLAAATRKLFRMSKMTGSSSQYPLVISPNNTGTTIRGLGYIAGTNALMNNTTNAVGQGASFTSDKIPVGTFLGKRTFDNIELKLSYALGPGDSVSLFYVTDDVPGGAIIGTMTSADDGVGKVFPVNWQNSQWLQIAGVMLPGTTATSTFCRIKEIRLRKSTN